MRKWLTALITLLMVFTLAACGADGINADPADVNNEQSVQQDDAQNSHAAGEEEGSEEAALEEEADRTIYPLTVMDDSGTEMTIEQAPQKIVSIAPSQTEILFALGLGDRIVGVGDYDNYPEEALEKPRVGNLQGNPEAILAVEPDIVFAGVSLNGSVVQYLRDLGITVYATEPVTIDEVIDSILKIGKITDAQAEAQVVAEKMRADKQYVLDRVSDIPEDQKKKVYIEYAPLWTAGKGSFMDELIVTSGGVNIASELDQWAQISPEAVIEANPDIIIYADITDYETGKPLVELIKTRPGWGSIEALKNDAIVGVNEDILSRPGPRITDALLEVAAGIYPELFE